MTADTPARKPRALHVHFWADIRNTAGSVEKVITAFASAGQRYEHLIAACPHGGVKHAEPYLHQGVPVYPFYENRLTNRVCNKMLRLGWFTYPALVRVIELLRPDVLHFHNRQELVDKVVARLRYRPAVCVHYHRHFARPVVPQSADRLIFVSQATADHILAHSSETRPHCVVANPLSAEIIQQGERAQAGVCTNSPPIILFGGGHSPNKGGAELIEAFAGLAPGSARLFLAGNRVETLPRLPIAGIEVLGQLSAEAFLERMSQADIIAMPSHNESFGLIAQEAMALGKVLVTTASGGMASFVDSECAVLCRPNDVASLRAALSHALALLHKPEESAALRTAARQRIERFAPERVIAELEACYDLALRHSGRSAKARHSAGRRNPEF